MRIITISREFGSGGRELGRRIAEALGYDYYDREIISTLARETDFNEDFLERILDTDVFPSFTLTFGKTFTAIGDTTVKGTGATKFLVRETQIIKEIAKKGKNCVIVGRNADLILKKYNPVNLFIYASMESKLQRCINHKGDENLSLRQLEKKIKKIDKNRSNHRHLLSNGKWGDKENFNLCINTSGFIIEDLVPAVIHYTNFIFEYKKIDL